MKVLVICYKLHFHTESHPVHHSGDVKRCSSSRKWTCRTTWRTDICWPKTSRWEMKPNYIWQTSTSLTTVATCVRWATSSALLNNPLIFISQVLTHTSVKTHQRVAVNYCILWRATIANAPGNAFGCVRLSVSVCPWSCSNLWKPWPGNFIFAMLVYIYAVYRSNSYQGPSGQGQGHRSKKVIRT